MQGAIFDPVHRTALDLAAEAVPAPAAILDIGCGTGRLLRAAAGRFEGARLEGVDASAEMVAAGRELLDSERISLRQGTAESLPASDGSYDLVFSTLTFHHWTDQQRGLEEVARVLTPGGRWLLADFVARGLLGMLRPVLRYRAPTTSELDRRLSRAGLAVKAARRLSRFGGQLPVLAIGRL